MSMISKVLLGLAASAYGQDEGAGLRTYVTTFGEAGADDGPVWEMEFEATDDDSAQALAEEESNAHTGVYPVKPYPRRPYATQNPGNGCCQDAAIYDTNNQECCVLPDNTHEPHPDRKDANGNVLQGVVAFPDTGAVGDLDLSPDVEVVPIGSCTGLGGTVVNDDALGDWGPAHYAKKK